MIGFDNWSDAHRGIGEKLPTRCAFARPQRHRALSGKNCSIFYILADAEQYVRHLDELQRAISSWNMVAIKQFCERIKTLLRNWPESADLEEPRPSNS